MSRYATQPIANEYYNAPVTNTTPATSIQAAYAENRDSPILLKPNDYYMAITRFQIPTGSIPLFDFVNNSMSVTIGATQTFLIYVSSGSIGGQQVNQPVRSIQDFLNMINTALNTSYVADGSKGGAGPPYMVFNRAEQVFSMIVPQAFFAAAGRIYMNNILWQKFGNFQSIFNGFDAALGQNFEIVVQNNGNGNLQVYPPLPYVGGVNSYIMSQEVGILSLLYDIQNIVVTSTINMNFESISASSGRSGNNASLNILTDFAVNFQPEDMLQPLIYNAELYRMIDLTSDQPMTNVNYQVFWEGKDRVLHPLILLPNETMYFKIGFFKKNMGSW